MAQLSDSHSTANSSKKQKGQKYCIVQNHANSQNPEYRARHMLQKGDNKSSINDLLNKLSDLVSQ